MTRRTAGCVSISGAAAGVVTTSTGPWRAASTSSSGVVSTTSPRKAVWMTRLVNLQDRQERLLWDLDRSHLLHALLSFFLLLEQLALARHVAPIALGGDVLAQRADRLAGDHFGPDRGLDHDLEQLARDQLFQLLDDLLAPLVRFVAMDDDRERVHRVAVEQHVELDEVGRAVLEELDRKSTRLNSSHGYISYAVFCLKKKKKNKSVNRNLLEQRVGRTTTSV